MLGIAYYSLFMIIGVIVADKLFKEKDIYFKIWSGGVIGNITLMCGIMPFAFIFGFSLISHILLGVVALGLCLALCDGFSFKKSVPNKTALSVGVLIFSVIFVLLENHILVPHSEGLSTGQSTYGDTAMHIGFITSIFQSGKFPPEFNLLSGNRLCYPFLVDSLSSSLCIFGTDLRTSVLVPSAVISALTIMGFYYFSKELVGYKAAILSMILFFFGGGFGFIYFLDGIVENPENFTRIFTEFYKTPTNHIDENIRWVNPICDMIIPQRTTMAGWCVLLFCLRMLIEAIKTEKRKIFIVLGIVSGCMPMIHTHSFLALAFISAFCVLLFYSDSQGKKNYIINWSIYAGLAFILSIGQLILWTFSHSVGNENFLRFGLNWVNHTDSYIWFWVKNLGITALFAIPAWFSQSKFNKKFSFGFLGLFILCEFVIFQPNEYDNNKLFFVVYMLFVCFVSGFLVKAYDKLNGVPARCFIAVLFVFLGIFSGVLSLLREFVSGGEYLFFTHEDVDASEFVKKNTEVDSVFLTGSDHRNPVAVLSGRTIYAGSELYVYYHGYKDEMYKRYEDMRRIYESRNESELMHNLHYVDDVDYIVISDRERTEYDITLDAFDSLEAVYHNGGTTIYKVNEIN
ncbi:MAG: hypothetical protein E7417_06105 [Ruminococcaceae bacterium]|nr:hypothetical protein [Oscillospiraceae bacterium]